MRFPPDTWVVVLVVLTIAWLGFVHLLGRRGPQWRSLTNGASNLALSLWLVAWGLDVATRGDHLFGFVSAAMGVGFLLAAVLDVRNALRERRSKDASDASRAGEPT